MTFNRVVDKIKELKKVKNVTILVHNYQRPEIYQVADFIGDSLELSRKSAQTKGDFILFCGVDFMAETAAILNPDKTVLIPVPEACCPMAAMVDIEGLGKLKQRYPKATIVSYVNTTAKIKAESDICCTSANAVEVVNSLPQNEIIFVPDKNLALYVARYTEKKIIPWMGYCYVHAKFTAKNLQDAKGKHPEAEVIVHPECRPEVIDLADYVCSTSQMLRRVDESDKKEFIIGTEVGLIERLKLLHPEKVYYEIPPGSTCIQMKKNNLQFILEALEKEQYKVTIPEDIRVKAKRALDRMLQIKK